MTLFHHIFCWLVPPKSTNRFHPGSKNDHRFRPTLQELISCWLIPPKYGTGSQNYRNHFSLSSGFNYILGRNQSNQMIKHCWSHIQNSIMWVSIWPSNGTGLISGWGLNSAPRIRIGVCLGLSGIYSLPVLVKYASRLFPCSSHHPQEFLNLEGRNPFYPAKKAEPGIFRIPDVFFTPGYRWGNIQESFDAFSPPPLRDKKTSGTRNIPGSAFLAG